MKIFLTAIAFFSLTSFAADQAAKFGAELTLKDSVTVDTAMGQFKKDPKKTFLIEAQVDKVCQKSGCWMTLKSKTSDLRITFKDYSFFVPLTLAGKTVLVEGTLNAKKLTLAQTKHYVEDEGGDPSKVTEAKTDYQMIASGVVVKN
ncbi:DUF4920 domain-containing protein [bacterium]|nr:DUF4920 domain-containing protein [bacterium]